MRQCWQEQLLFAAAVLLIGKEDTSVDESVDGYTGATARNPLDEVVTYVK